MNAKSKLAAVLLPFHYEHDGSLAVSLIRRAPGGSHGGQLAFPGGKFEIDDGNLQETALRETEEEVGLHRSSISHLHALQPIHTMHTGYTIHPYAGLLKSKPENWQIQITEVQEVFSVGLNELLQNHDSHQVSDPRFNTFGQFPCYRVAGYPLWGASYRMIRPLLQAYENDSLVFEQPL